MQINGTIFNVDVYDVITELQSQLALNGINLFAKYFDSGDNLMVCCPYHKDGQERRPSAGIRKDDGVFHCLACNRTVGLDEMIANCFGHADPLWGYKWLTKNFLTIKVEERADIEIDLERNNISNKASVLDSSDSDKSVYVSDTELDKYRYTHQYMYERGLNDNIIEFFDIGYDKDTDTITFPVRDLEGNCLFVARRNVRYKRFDLPKNIDKPLYGLYELSRVIYSGTRGKRAPDVYVCEGLFDCLRLWCNGKIAVAGFGCLFSEYQMKLLDEIPTRRLILALDNDKAGRDANQRIRKRIMNKLITEVVLPQGRKDIGECTDDEIHNLQEVFS